MTAKRDYRFTCAGAYVGLDENGIVDAPPPEVGREMAGIAKLALENARRIYGLCPCKTCQKTALAFGAALKAMPGDFVPVARPKVAS
jgi:hypothetical protein